MEECGFHVGSPDLRASATPTAAPFSRPAGGSAVQGLWGAAVADSLTAEGCWLWDTFPS